MSIDNASYDEWNKAYRANLPVNEYQEERMKEWDKKLEMWGAEPININDWYAAYRNVKPGEAVPVPEGHSVATLADYIKQKQVGGDHYKSNIEPWDVFLDWALDPWACNVIKYVQRHRKKAGKQDLEKAKHYLEFMIANYDKVGEKYYGSNT